MQTMIDDNKLKHLLKEAFAEALEEQRGIFLDLITEAMEDMAMVQAIQEGENTETVSKKEIFDILDGQD